MCGADAGGVRCAESNADPAGLTGTAPALFPIDAPASADGGVYPGYTPQPSPEPTREPRESPGSQTAVRNKANFVGSLRRFACIRCAMMCSTEFLRRITDESQRPDAPLEPLSRMSAGSLVGRESDPEERETADGRQNSPSFLPEWRDPFSGAEEEPPADATSLACGSSAPAPQYHPGYAFGNYPEPPPGGALGGENALSADFRNPPVISCYVPGIAGITRGGETDFNRGRNAAPTGPPMDAGVSYR